MARHASQRRAARSPATGAKKPQEQKQDEKKEQQKEGAKGPGKGAARLAARRPAWLQARMAVSQPGDALEQEAEQVARAVAKPDAKKDEGKAAKRLARKEIDAEAKLEKKREEQQAKAQAEADAGAKAQGAKDEATAKKGAEPEAAQRRPRISRAVELAQPLQRRAHATEPARAVEQAGADVERRIDVSRGGGTPLPPDARGDMEQRLGHDFSGVRVHADAGAESLAHQLDAEAFTVGQDVYFGAGRFAPGTAEGDHLLAHELTHVVQQGGAGPAAAAGDAARTVARAPKSDGAKKEESKLSEDGNEYKSGKDRVNKESKEFEIASVKIPAIKREFVTPKQGYVLPPRRDRTDGHRAAWDEAVVPEAGAALDKKLGKSNPVEVDGRQVWYLEIGSSKSYVAGTRETIAKRVARPYWTSGGKTQTFDVDHKLEWQLGGGDEVENLWLLHSSANRACGSIINAELESKVGALLADARAAGLKLPGTTAETIRGPNWTVRLMEVKGGANPNGSGTAYERADVAEGASLRPLNVLSHQQVQARKLAGTAEQFTLFTNSTGGRAIAIPAKDGKASLDKPVKLGSSFELTSISVDMANNQGTASGNAFRKSEHVTPLDGIKLSIVPHEAVAFGGTIAREGLKSQVESGMKAKGFSPIELLEAELGDGGIGARGFILPSIPALAGSPIDFAIDGGAVTISKTIAADAVKLPGPIQITGGALTVFAGSKGIGVEGSMGFEVEKLCTGSIKAGAGMAAGGAGFVLEGKCRVREDLFDPGTLEFRYEASEGAAKLSGSAELGIKTDKLKFVKSASGKVTVADDQWGVDGTVELDVPGAEEAKLTIGRAPDGTVTIGGKIAVGAKGPLEGGSIDATLEKGDQGWKAKGTGSADLAVPGLDSASVTIDYDDGAFTAIGNVAYKKGMLDGSVRAGVTNRAVDESGTPAGPPTPELTVFGKGTVSLQIAPWLKGTVGIELLANGEVEITGEVALPSSIDLFPEKRFDKNLFSIGIDIPIVGFTIMGQRIGIFATIGGGMDFSAGVGPGQLRDAKLAVKYNPAHEDQTEVDGSASFVIPADAGLTLKVHGGIGAGIPVVSATAGLEVAGKVGIEGEARADAQVHWNPRDGLKLHAEASLSAQPVFKFDVSGFVKVEIDLLLWEETLYEKRWSLASFEYGSDMKLGVKFPVDYDEQNGLDLSLDNIEVTYPQIDAGSLLGGLIDKL